MADLDDDDIVALTVLLARQIMAQDDKAVAEAERKAAEEQIADAAKRMANCRSAFAAFGFDITEVGLWDSVKDAIGAEAWSVAFARARPTAQDEHSSHERGDGTARASGDEDTTNEADADAASPHTASGEAEDQGKQSVRVLVLKYLSEAGESGLKASELRVLIEASQGVRLHDKTIGMTLYRLSRDDLARRVKRTWFSVPPPLEAEEPDNDQAAHAEGDE